MGWISALWQRLAPATMNAAEARAIDAAVDRVDARLRVVSGYRQRLAPAMAHARAHCEQLVAAIPGPIDIDVRAFGSDPLVHALFAAPDDIARMLAASRELRAFVADPAHLQADRFYGLVGMRRREKTVPGLARQGQLIHEDVPQRLLYFSDHTLYDVSADPDGTRRRLCDSSFESLLASFREQLETLRGERQSLHAAWAQERTLGAGAAAEARRERRRELEETTRELDASLQPAHVVDALAAWLSDPAPHLHLVSTAVSVDRLGVVAEADDAPGVRTVNFPELVGRDRRQWTVLLARISRDDALQALEESRQAERYLVI